MQLRSTGDELDAARSASDKAREKIRASSVPEAINLGAAIANPNLMENPERSTLRDRDGRLLGWFEPAGRILQARDRHGAIVGWYDPHNDHTRDRNGRIVGKGDLLASPALLPGLIFPTATAENRTPQWRKVMSVLKKLKLSSAAPVHVADPKQNARAKLVRYLIEQKALAQSELEGRVYSATKVVFRTGENGQRIRAEARRHVRRGWFRDASGLLFFQARYGNKPLDLGKGMTSIEVGNLGTLPQILDALMEATSNGELDEALIAAAAERRSNFKRRAKSPA